MALLDWKVPNSNFIVYFLDVLSKNIFTWRLECRSIYLEASFALPIRVLNLYTLNLSVAENLFQP